MNPRKPVLTAQELEIMKVVWARGTASVRDVYEALLERRKIAYTTVMTMMNILEQKGYLKKTAKPGAYRSHRARRQSRVTRGWGRGFVNRFSTGAAEPLLLHLVEDRRLTREDLDEIRRMLEERKP